MIDRRRLSFGIAAAGFTAVATPLAAQQRAVRLIVPASAGGAIDVIGRLYAQRLSELLGQTWVIENKSGASNTIGAAEVARADPDGSTLLTNADIQIMARHVMRSVSYEPITDFTPISRFATSPMLLVGNPRETPATLAELIKAFKAQPDRFSFANSALGSMGHLATESFLRRIDSKTLIVNYRGTVEHSSDLETGVLHAEPGGDGEGGRASTSSYGTGFGARSGWRRKRWRASTRLCRRLQGSRRSSSGSSRSGPSR